MKTAEFKEAIERIRQNVQSQLELVQQAEDVINLDRDANELAALVDEARAHRDECIRAART